MRLFIIPLWRENSPQHEDGMDGPHHHKLSLVKVHGAFSFSPVRQATRVGQADVVKCGSATFLFKVETVWTKAHSSVTCSVVSLLVI